MTNRVSFDQSPGAGFLARVDAALAVVRDEIISAEKKHPGPFMSSHEGYAILLEEVDELWDDVKRNNPAGAVKEAVQVAAMATKYVMNLKPLAN